MITFPPRKRRGWGVPQLLLSIRARGRGCQIQQHREGDKTILKEKVMVLLNTLSLSRLLKPTVLSHGGLGYGRYDQTYGSDDSPTADHYKEITMLCFHCGTVVIFDKESWAKIVTQDGVKKFYHLQPCFHLEYLEVALVRKELPHEAKHQEARPAGDSPACSAQGEWGIGAILHKP